MIDEVFQMSLFARFDLETVLLSYGLPHLEFPPERFPPMMIDVSAPGLSLLVPCKRCLFDFSFLQS